MQAKIACSSPYMIARDEKGNGLYRFDSSTGQISFYLRLAPDAPNALRFIATLDPATHVLTFRRNRNRHLYRNDNSYAFSYWLMASIPYEILEVSDETGIYRVPKDMVNSHGKALQFEGFERQIALPINIIERYKFSEAKTSEFKRVQLNIFS